MNKRIDELVGQIAENLQVAVALMNEKELGLNEDEENLVYLCIAKSALDLMEITLENNKE